VKHPKQPRTPEVKTVTLKFRTTLTNKELAYVSSLAVQWMLSDLTRIVGSTALVAKPRVEAVGKR
jgi:hypothetical protein